MVVPCRRFGTNYRSHLQGYWTDRLSRNVRTNYHYTLRKIPEERRALSSHDLRLKSTTVVCSTLYFREPFAISEQLQCFLDTQKKRYCRAYLQVHGNYRICLLINTIAWTGYRSVPLFYSKWKVTTVIFRRTVLRILVRTEPVLGFILSFCV
jgi:hypothetical protein